MFNLLLSSKSIMVVVYAIILIAVLLLGSWYIKTCVAAEFDDLKQNIRNKKMQLKNKNNNVDNKITDNNDDLKSYLDPLANNEPLIDDSPNIINNDNELFDDDNIYNSQFNKDDILMRDIMDKNYMHAKVIN
jgi:hypothetical protein